MAESWTPPKLAKHWGVNPDKVRGFIERGELRAFDVSENAGSGKPRWRVPADAVVEFEQRP